MITHVEGIEMAKSVIEVTPKTVFGYALFFIGIILLGYTAFQCFLLANGTIEPLKVEVTDTVPSGAGLDIFFGIILQIGANGLLVAISYILMKIGISITKP